MTETHSKKIVRVKFRHPILFWGGLVGKIEDKVHLSPAEVEIGAELGNMFHTNPLVTTQEELI